MSEEKLRIKAKVKSGQGKYTEQLVDFDFHSGDHKKGIPITSEVFEDLIQKPIYGSEVSEDEPVAYLFGRKQITLLLSQNGCEGFALCKCINPEGQSSLAIYGVGKDGYPLNTIRKKSNGDTLIIYEWVGKKTKKEMVKELGIEHVLKQPEPDATKTTSKLLRVAKKSSLQNKIDIGKYFKSVAALI